MIVHNIAWHVTLSIDAINFSADDGIVGTGCWRGKCSYWAKNRSYAIYGRLIVIKISNVTEQLFFFIKT